MTPWATTSSTRAPTRCSAWRRTDGEGTPRVGPSAAGYPGAGFTYLAANSLRRETGGPIFPPYTVLERDGVRIGFIGVTTLEIPDTIVPDDAEDFRFTDISRTVNRRAAELESEGIEAIVALAHSGALDTDRGATANRIVTETRQMSESVDVVFSGHTHERLDLRVKNKLVVQSKEYGTDLGVVDLRIDRASGEVTDSKTKRPRQ